MSAGRQLRVWTFRSFKDEINIDNEYVRYAIWQQERVPGSDELRFQGYIEFSAVKTAEYVRQVLGDDAAQVEGRVGTRKYAREYCSKESFRVAGPWEVGDWDWARNNLTTRKIKTEVNENRAEAEPTASIDLTAHSGNDNERGRRSMFEEFLHSISTMTDAELYERFPAMYALHYKAVSHIRLLTTQPRSWRMEVIILWGGSGSGKRRYCRQHWPNAFWKSPLDMRWDGYQQEETVIIDRFSPRFMRARYVLRLFEKYPMQVKTSRGRVQFVSRRIVITAKTPPESWYSDIETRRLTRLVTSIQHFGGESF